MKLAHLDPRVKLFLLGALSAVALATVYAPTLLALLVLVLVLLIAGGVKPTEIWRKMRGFLGLVATLFVLQCIFNRNGDALISMSGVALITDAGLQTALLVTLRLLIIILGALIVATGEARDYLLSLTTLRVPYEIAFMALTALRFLPMLRDEARDVFYAAQMRGLRVKKAGLRKQLSAYSFIMLPVVAGAIQRAEQISIAMEARGFRAFPQRTTMRRLKMRKADWLYISVFCAVLAAIFILNKYRLITYYLAFITCLP